MTNIDIVGAREAPYRDNEWYFLFPPKNNDYGPRRFGEHALSLIEKDGILIADYTLWRPLLYLQVVEKQRPDVSIVWVERILRQGVPEYILQQACDRPIYLATDTPGSYYQLDLVQTSFQTELQYPVLRIIRDCE